MLSLFLGSLWFFLPIGMANMTPVVMTRLFGEGTPIDGGIHWKGKPILGSNKTWMGLVSGTIVGGLFFLLQIWLYNQGVFTSVEAFATAPWYVGFLMGFGALFGDSAKSFFKRRLNVKSGKPWVPFDQVDYVVGGLLFTWFVWPLAWQPALIVLIGYPLATFIVSTIGYYTGLRKDRF